MHPINVVVILIALLVAIYWYRHPAIPTGTAPSIWRTIPIAIGGFPIVLLLLPVFGAKTILLATEYSVTPFALGLIFLFLCVFVSRRLDGPVDETMPRKLVRFIAPLAISGGVFGGYLITLSHLTRIFS